MVGPHRDSLTLHNVVDFSKYLFILFMIAAILELRRRTRPTSHC